MFRGTTIIAVRRGKQVAMGGDGQVTLGDTVMKHGARKVRWLYDDRSEYRGYRQNRKMELQVVTQASAPRLKSANIP